jgi:hypothetical protein
MLDWNQRDWESHNRRLLLGTRLGVPLDFLSLGLGLLHTCDDCARQVAYDLRAAGISTLRFVRSNALCQTVLGGKDDGLTGPINVRIVLG